MKTIKIYFMIPVYALIILVRSNFRKKTKNHFHASSISETIIRKAKEATRVKFGIYDSHYYHYLVTNYGTSAGEEGEEDAMGSYDISVQTAIVKVLSSQRLAVLSTVRDGQPYASLMAFAHTPDLETVVIATGTASRKFVNLSHESRVSLLVDTRSNCEADFHAAEALTIVGTATRIPAGQQGFFRNLYLERHPYLEDFLASPATVLMQVQVRHYLLVNRFQNVMEYHLGDEKDIFA